MSSGVGGHPNIFAREKNALFQTALSWYCTCIVFCKSEARYVRVIAFVCACVISCEDVYHCINACVHYCFVLNMSPSVQL